MDNLRKGNGKGSMYITDTAYANIHHLRNMRHMAVPAYMLALSEFVYMLQELNNTRTYTSRTATFLRRE